MISFKEFLNETVHLIHKNYTQSDHDLTNSMLKTPKNFSREQHSAKARHHLELGNYHHKKSEDARNKVSNRDYLYYGDIQKHKNISSFHYNMHDKFMQHRNNIK